MIAALATAWFLTLLGNSPNLPVRHRGDNTSCGDIAIEGISNKVPRKFQGYWADETGHIKISASTIDFGLDPKSKIISVSTPEITDNPSESCNPVMVKYAAGPSSEYTLLWYLTKVFGRQILISVDAEHPPVSIFVYQRGRTWR